MYKKFLDYSFDLEIDKDSEKELYQFVLTCFELVLDYPTEIKNDIKIYKDSNLELRFYNEEQMSISYRFLYPNGQLSDYISPIIYVCDLSTINITRQSSDIEYIFPYATIAINKAKLESKLQQKNDSSTNHKNKI